VRTEITEKNKFENLNDRFANLGTGMIQRYKFGGPVKNFTHLFISNISNSQLFGQVAAMISRG
jgi:hypothetical protein